MEAFTAASAAFSSGFSGLCNVTSVYGSVVATQGKQIITQRVPKTGSAAVVWALENPAMAVGAVVGTTGIIIIASPGLIYLPVLSIVGFGPGGVESATIAAGIHSGIGNVGAGTWFATMQSAAAGGAGAAIVHGVVQGCGVMMAGAGGGLTWAKSKLWFLGNGPAGST